MARKRRVSWLSVFYFVVTLGALVGGSVWLDRNGEPVVAKITSKTEEITVTHDPQGGWYRYYRVGAEFDAAGTLMSATVTRLDRERYDALHLGDSLHIRYLSFLPLFARTPTVRPRRSPPRRRIISSAATCSGGSWSACWRW